ncbi:hypothetical protein [Bifidobacterium eulemuris]|uniref:Uncharacterized protein n=1 Tax=Bifidobacterium eulemuris TaxID=1765219 RepID=A0A261GAM8_9BIFI|nr:hypothetical protein [Bifidobacterium eulemuris]OZG68235.1 hypothetical protein BEUL_1248 [Bifidobacterium eulemuris]QOL31709.1 hypothetical protein BE0216_03950 [Bifidobacterium eulemuris]
MTSPIETLAEQVAEERYPAQYWLGREPSGDRPGRLRYLEGVTSEDMREAFVQGAVWWARHEPTSEELDVAALALFVGNNIGFDEDDGRGLFERLPLWREGYRVQAGRILRAARNTLLKEES